jgi:hypothetical protein
MTLIAMATLALAVLWRSSPDYRIAILVIVSVAAVMLAIRALSARKPIWGLVYLGVLGVFTPFRSSHFSHALVSTIDMATLALFAVSPIVLKKSRTPVVSSPPSGSVVRSQPFINQPE